MQIFINTTLFFISFQWTFVILLSNIGDFQFFCTKPLPVSTKYLRIILNCALFFMHAKHDE